MGPASQEQSLGPLCWLLSPRAVSDSRASSKNTSCFRAHLSQRQTTSLSWEVNRDPEKGWELGAKGRSWTLPLPSLPEERRGPSGLPRASAGPSVVPSVNAEVLLCAVGARPLPSWEAGRGGEDAPELGDPVTPPETKDSCRAQLPRLVARGSQQVGEGPSVQLCEMGVPHPCSSEAQDSRCQI